MSAYDLEDNIGYGPQMNLTWLHTEAGHWMCYFDHIRAFLYILGSVGLSETTQGLDIWAEFDFRRLSLRPDYPSPVRGEVKLLVQNVRNLYYVNASTEAYVSWIYG